MIAHFAVTPDGGASWIDMQFLAARVAGVAAGGGHARWEGASVRMPKERLCRTELPRAARG